MSNHATCRFCAGTLAEFVDFGMSPLSATPLVAYVCRDCLLVQLQPPTSPDKLEIPNCIVENGHTGWRYMAKDTVV